MTRILAITSGTSAAGKTLVAINLATRFAQRGQRVCLLDAGHGPDNASTQLELQPDFTLMDLIQAGSNLQQALVHSDYGFDLLAVAPDSCLATDLDHQQLEKLAATLAGLQDYDVILIDLASATSRELLAFALASPEVILVVTPEPAHMTGAYTCLKLLQGEHFSGRLQILVNRCPDNAAGKQACDKFQQVASFYLGYELPLLGVVHEDESISGSNRDKTPLLVSHPQSIASRDISGIAGELRRGINSDAIEYFKRYIQEIDIKDKDDSFEVISAMQFQGTGRLEKQLESLTGQVDALIAEIGRLRKTEPVCLQNWVNAHYSPSATATTSDNTVYPVYEFQQSDGNRLRFACHSLDADVEPNESRTSSS